MQVAIILFKKPDAFEDILLINELSSFYYFSA